MWPCFPKSAKNSSIAQTLLDTPWGGMLGKAGPNHLGLHPAAEVRTEVLPDLRHALRGGVEAVVGVLDVADVVQWGAGGGGCGGGQSQREQWLPWSSCL